MVTAETSYAFGKACELTAKLFEDFDKMFEACRDRLDEIGSSTEHHRNAISDMEAATSKMRSTIGPMMSDAYLKIYADEIEERNKYD